jgi:predicted outer membrane repeat protein
LREGIAMHATLSPRCLLLGLLLTMGPALFGVLLDITPALAQDTIYVNHAAIGDNNGTSWDDAYTSLQSALERSGGGDAIWVARGVYTPTYIINPGDPLSYTFRLKNGVALYGGFAGGEEALGERDWQTHVTVLSGDLAGDDTLKTSTGIVTGAAGIQGSNAYHVVTGVFVTGTAILDGFTITAGNANGAAEYPCGNMCGGGMHNVYSSPTVVNVDFVGNQTDYFGGGMYNYSSSPTLTNVTFSGNAAGFHGGGMYNEEESAAYLTHVTFSGNRATENGGGMANRFSSSPTLANVVFSGNRADEGGGLYNYEWGSPTLTNVTFCGNQATGYGGGMYNLYSSSPLIQNSIVWGNSAADDGDQLYYADAPSRPTIRYSVVQGGLPAGSTDGGNNLAGDSDPRFVRAPFCGTDGRCTDDTATPGLDESADDDYGDLRLQPDSPAIDAGDNAADLDGTGTSSATIAGLATDLAGQPRLAAVRSAAAVVDLGTYEAVNQAPTFTSTPDLAVNEDSLYTYTVITADDTGGPWPITVKRKPAWLSFADQGDGTADLTGTPGNAVVGTNPVILEVQDALGLKAQQSYSVQVANVNDAPFFISSPVTTATEDNPYSYLITTGDADIGDTRALSLTTMPGWVTLVDHGDGTAALGGTPDNALVGTHPVVVRVEDAAHAFAVQPFTITVGNVNDAPAFTSGCPPPAAVGVTYTHTLATADEDLGDTCALATPSKPEWLSLTDHGDGTGTLTGTPAAEHVGSATLALRVEDAGGLQGKQRCTLVVTPPAGDMRFFLPNLCK